VLPLKNFHLTKGEKPFSSKKKANFHGYIGKAEGRNKLNIGDNPEK